MQIHDLKAYIKRRGWKLGKVYIDEGYTGTNKKRPAFIKTMEDAQKRNFDILLVWKLDRLSRSMKDLINTLEELGHWGIDFISYDNSLDTSSPTGKLVFHVIGAVAEFERNIIQELVKAGLENARRKGKRLERKPVLTPHIENKIKSFKTEKLSNWKIAKKLDIS